MATTRRLHIQPPDAPAIADGVAEIKREQGLPLLRHLAAEGWVGFNANYRLSPGATFPDHLVDVLLDVAVSGINRWSGSVSHTHPSRFVLIASMNPEEGDLLTKTELSEFTHRMRQQVDTNTKWSNL